MKGSGEFTKLASELAYGKDSKPLSEGKVRLRLSNGRAYDRLPSLSLSLVLVVSGSQLGSSPSTSRDPRKSTCLTLLGETISLWLKDLVSRSCDTGLSSLFPRQSGGAD